MLCLKPQLPDNRPARLLCLGSHCDDIEIGCGGTLLRLTREYSAVSVRWVTFTSNEQRAAECRACADAFLHNAGDRQVDIHDFRDGFLPYQGMEVKSVFERLKSEFEPDLILTHHLADRHQDHRLIAELTWNTFRDHLIFEYEIPKYDGDLGQPDVFIPIDREDAERKIQYLMEYYPTQRTKRWYTEDTFHAMLRLRGIESACPTGLAEAFHARKILI